MRNLLIGTLAAVCLSGACFTTAPATAREAMDLRAGDLSISIDNGHYYDRHHHRQSYTYPSDWRSYHHPRSWYRGHSQWNDRNHADWYRN